MKLPLSTQHLGKNVVVVLSLLAAGFFGAWLRFQPHLAHGGGFTDGVREYDGLAQDPIRYAVWDQAQPLAGALQNGEAEHRPAVSDDGRWLVFVSGERGNNSELWISPLRDGKAEEPRPLYGLNSRFDELSPAFAGNRLYFASNRPGVGGFDLYWAEEGPAGEFGAPQALHGDINGPRDELDPAPLPGGTALAFSSNRNMAGRTGHDFYLALPGAADGYVVHPMERLNSWQDDRELAFTRDGRRAFFASNRPREGTSGPGDYNLFASLAEHGSWLKPRPVEGLNSTAHERGPAPDVNGFEMIFERSGASVVGEGFATADLFHAKTLEIFQRPGPRVGWLDLIILIALLVMALLAFLAKRWDAIEVLYKCFLVSLLVHGAMLYCFRDIHPDSQPVELQELSPSYRVQLIASNSSAASRSERGGVLDVVPQNSSSTPVSAPQRFSGEAREAISDSVPGTVELKRKSSPGPSSTAQAIAWQPADSTADTRASRLNDAPDMARVSLSARRVSTPLTPVAMQAQARVPVQGQASTSRGLLPQMELSKRAEAAAPVGRHLARESDRTTRSVSAESLPTAMVNHPGATATPAGSKLREASLVNNAGGPKASLNQPRSKPLALAAKNFGSLSRRTLAASAQSPSRGVLTIAATPVDLAMPLRGTVVADTRRTPKAKVELELERFAHSPYRARFGPAKARALEEHGGNRATEAAVAAGLGYLAGVQHPTGFWGKAGFGNGKYGEVRVGKTGLCLLAFLGAGHTPASDDEFSKVTQRAVSFLLSAQDQRTGHFGPTSSYSHGIATYALAESFALTGAENLRAPLERAVAEILRHQQRQTRDLRRLGGWGYYGDEVRAADNWPRASITAWQVMALESARLAGLQVPEQVFNEARSFLLGCLDQRRGAFRYSHDPARLNGAYGILPGSTPAALFALSLLKVDLEGREFAGSWQFLRDREPVEYRYQGDDAFVYEAQGNLYFWYYGSLASMRRGGNTWKRWNVRLQETLLGSQRGDGSWKPISIYAKTYAGDGRRDASYSTAMNVLSLEVYYRYFTPLLMVGGQGEGGR